MRRINSRFWLNTRDGFRLIYRLLCRNAVARNGNKVALAKLIVLSKRPLISGGHARDAYPSGDPKHGLLSPVLHVVSPELLSYHVALVKGANVDTR
jgi:glucosamine 6-phosphate synthetase-like amidotransferase/phosphosugar isomerase protein